MQLGSFAKVEQVSVPYGSLEHGELFMLCDTSKENENCVFVKSDERDPDGDYWAMKIAGDVFCIGELLSYVDSEDVYPVVIERGALFRFATQAEIEG